APADDRDLAHVEPTLMQLLHGPLHRLSVRIDGDNALSTLNFGLSHAPTSLGVSRLPPFFKNAAIAEPTGTRMQIFWTVLMRGIPVDLAFLKRVRDRRRGRSPRRLRERVG